MQCFLFEGEGWHGEGALHLSAAEGVPHEGMGGARTDWRRAVTGPLIPDASDV